MFKRYRKSDAPGWQRKLVLLLGFLLASTLLLFLVWAVFLYY